VHHCLTKHVAPGEEQARVSAAMQNAIAVLEGMLWGLPPAAILSRLLRARITPDDDLIPARLLGPLLHPSGHAAVSPQTRSRIAGLLLQV
jgi:hypothetical protein